MYSCKQKVNTTEGTGVITSQTAMEKDGELYYWVMLDSDQEEYILCEDEISPLEAEQAPIEETTPMEFLLEVLDEIYEMEYKLFLLRKRVGDMITNQ